MQANYYFVDIAHICTQCATFDLNRSTGIVIKSWYCQVSFVVCFIAVTAECHEKFCTKRVQKLLHQNQETTNQSKQTKPNKERNIKTRCHRM